MPWKNLTRFARQDVNPIFFKFILECLKNNHMDI
jgi:hypothetical protein